MLNMMEVDTCYFAVWTPAQLHVERVARDSELWSGVMMPALLQFYRYTVTIFSSSSLWELVMLLFSGHIFWRISGMFLTWRRKIWSSVKLMFWKVSGTTSQHYLDMV